MLNELLSQLENSLLKNRSMKVQHFQNSSTKSCVSSYRKRVDLKIQLKLFHRLAEKRKQKPKSYFISIYLHKMLGTGTDIFANCCVSTKLCSFGKSFLAGPVYPFVSNGMLTGCERSFVSLQSEPVILIFSELNSINKQL